MLPVVAEILIKIIPGHIEEHFESQPTESSLVSVDYADDICLLRSRLCCIVQNLETQLSQYQDQVKAFLS